MNIGDRVVPIKGRLVSGCDIYDYAIIKSLDPFILVSEERDMTWYTICKCDVKIAHLIVSHKKGPGILLRE